MIIIHTHSERVWNHQRANKNNLGNIVERFFCQVICFCVFVSFRVFLYLWGACRDILFVCCFWNLLLLFWETFVKIAGHDVLMPKEIDDSRNNLHNRHNRNVRQRVNFFCNVLYSWKIGNHFKRHLLAEIHWNPFAFKRKMKNRLSFPVFQKNVDNTHN